MKKAVLKRFKITKNGEMLRKKAGQNHFNAKQSRRTQLRKKGFFNMTTTNERNIKQYIHQNN